MPNALGILVLSTVCTHSPALSSSLMELRRLPGLSQPWTVFLPQFHYQALGMCSKAPLPSPSTLLPVCALNLPRLRSKPIHLFINIDDSIFLAPDRKHILLCKISLPLRKRGRDMVNRNRDIANKPSSNPTLPVPSHDHHQ